MARAAAPEGYRIVMGHRCGYAGREYIHFTLQKNGELLSLVIAKKGNGETLEGLAVSKEITDIPIHQSAGGRYQVAAFDAGNFFAYIVSDLKGRENHQIASAMAPGVREFLMKMPAYGSGNNCRSIAPYRLWNFTTFFSRPVCGSPAIMSIAASRG